MKFQNYHYRSSSCQRREIFEDKCLQKLKWRQSNFLGDSNHKGNIGREHWTEEWEKNPSRSRRRSVQSCVPQMLAKSFQVILEVSRFCKYSPSPLATDSPFPAQRVIWQRQGMHSFTSYLCSHKNSPCHLNVASLTEVDKSCAFLLNKSHIMKGDSHQSFCWISID